MTDTIKVTIDGHVLNVPKGTLVIEAARQAGVMIPHFCYHPKLKPDANCRMCLVEIEKIPKLQTSCSTPVADGMVVRTATPIVNQARKSVLEFILANHPLDCPVCDQGGRCDLQDFSHQYTPTTSRFIEIKRVFQKEYFSPLIEKEMNRCVQCLRCVRYCDEVMDVKALAPVGRGTMTEIKHFGPHELDCEFCGGCVQICPVGAITSRLSMYEFRPWMLKRADTVCTYCGDGCRITIQTKNNELIEVNSAQGAGRNNGDLCPRGFFGYHVSTHPDRLTHPLIRREGKLVEATWEDALEYVAQACIDLKLRHGAQAFAGLIGGRCTNEDLYVFQKFMRLVLGTNKIDSSARYGQVNGIHAMRRVQGTHRWTVTFEDLVKADTILLVGTNLTETNPITGLKVKEAVKRRGAKLITVEPLVPAVGKISNITNLAHHHFGVRPDQFSTVVLGLIKAIVEDNLVDAGLASRAGAFVQAVRTACQAVSWSLIESRAGLAASAVRDAARALATGTRVIVLVGQGVLRQTGGAGIATNLLDLLLLTGHHDRPGCGFCPLAEENNDQGAVEMGTVAECLPGPVDLGDREARERLTAAWKEELPQGPGRRLLDIIEEARSGAVKALFVVGENPVGSLPTSARVAEALERLDLLVCQELFMTETAALSDVVLPACSYAEKDGTFTNTEGLVQQLHQAINTVGDSRPDWEILSALSVLIGYPLEYGGTREIFKEIRAAIPGYALLGPVATPPRPVADVVNRYLREGYRSDLTQRYRVAEAGAPGPDELTLIVAQTLFHSGKFSTRAKGLMRVQDKPYLGLNPEDAARRHIEEGDRVHVSNEHGAFETTATIMDRLPAGLASVPEHFDAELQGVLSVSVDPETGVPCYKTTRVTIARIARVEASVAHAPGSVEER